MSDRAMTIEARSAALLVGFTADQFQRLLSAGTVLECRAGETFLREGDEGHEMFLISEGTVRIVGKKAAGGEALIAMLGAGESFGELALVSRFKRKATVHAMTDLKVLVISQDFLLSLMESMPDIAIKLLCNLVFLLGDKLRATSERMMEALSENAMLATRLAGDWTSGGRRGLATVASLTPTAMLLGSDKP